MDTNVTEFIENLSDRKVLTKCIYDETVTALEKLDNIWDKMGIDTELREQRAKVVLKHVRSLYSDMLSEAEEQNLKLAEAIESLLQKVTALGKELQMDVSLHGYEEMALNTIKNELQDKLKKYEEIYNARKTEIEDIISKEEKLCVVLGRKPKSLNTSPLPKSDEIEDFRKYVEDLSVEKLNREELFLKTKSEILEIVRELKVKPSLEFAEKIVGDNEVEFLVSDENMTRLAKYHESLAAQLAETAKELQQLRETVVVLWELLEEDPQRRSEFLETHAGNTLDNLRMFKKEIKRCEEKKRANIKVFVDKLRAEIISWWDLCRYNVTQREEFTHFRSNTYTEDLLALHELQLEKLKNFYESNKTIFNLITKREEMWEKMLELERRANEPDRYKNRGGELLREEKERKTVALRLPKIEEELLMLVNEYEKKTGEKFLVSGELVSDLIARAWATHKEDKHLKLSAKKQAREQPIHTPRKSPLPPSHSRLAPPVTPAKRKIAMTLFGFGKRNKHTTNIPKIQVNGSTIKRASMERKSKMEKRRKSRALREHNETVSSTATDYNEFEAVAKTAAQSSSCAQSEQAKGIEAKPFCRSTLFTNNSKKRKENVPATPKKELLSLNNNATRTTNKSKLRSGSPIAPSSHLSAAPGNLPIII